jgi:hypothetical protein
MNFLMYDLGSRSRGASVRVTLSGNAANVMLLDDLSLSNYRSGRPFQYFGGHATRSPVVLTVPHAAHWHVVVDMGGARGEVSASVEVVA